MSTSGAEAGEHPVGTVLATGDQSNSSHRAAPRGQLSCPPTRAIGAFAAPRLARIIHAVQHVGPCIEGVARKTIVGARPSRRTARLEYCRPENPAYSIGHVRPRLFLDKTTPGRSSTNRCRSIILSTPVR